MARKTDLSVLPYRPCVGVLLFDRQGRVLVARRVGSDNSWQLPQGGIDKGEDPKSAALRELHEEIGTDKAEIAAECPEWLRYDFPPEVARAVRKGRYRGQEQKWFAMRFIGTDADIDLDHSGHPEFDAWKWVEIDHLPDLIVAFKRPVYVRLVELFAPLVRPGF